MPRRRPFILSLSLLTAIPAATASADSARLVTQTTSSDCGPAALATLLTFYLDVPATEREMMKLAGTTPENGTSLKGLEAAATAKGLGADSFRMNYATLREQVKTYPAPVIVRLLLPQPHFVLVLAMDENQVAVADPAIGNYMISRRVFERRWFTAGPNEGYVFIAAREDGRTNVVNRDKTVQGILRAQQNLQRWYR